MKFRDLPTGLNIVDRSPINAFRKSGRTSVSNLHPPTDISVSQRSPAGSPLEVLRIFLKLGLTCFGGPIAHIGYFRDEFVVRRKWIDEHAYADLVGLCQFLPGPASSQVGFSIGTYDTTRPLVIDPTLSYATYVGGNNDEYGLGVARHSAHPL